MCSSSATCNLLYNISSAFQVAGDVRACLVARRVRLLLVISQYLAPFLGCRRNGLATSVSSNYYFRCLKVGGTNQISEHCHMTTVKPNSVMH